MKLGDPPDEHILSRIRQGDEAAYRQLVDRYNASLIRVACCYVRDRAAAEEVTQETWLGLLKGLDRFEGRAALRTWLFRILTNKAKDRAKKDSRYVPFPALVGTETTADDPSMDPELFQRSDEVEPGHWRSQTPRRWVNDPEQSLLTREALACVQGALDELPRAQRAVLVLRQLQGCTSDEVCNILDITETNQRVLLHRARSKVRRAVDRYFSHCPIEGRPSHSQRDELQGAR